MLKIFRPGPPIKDSFWLPHAAANFNCFLFKNRKIGHRHCSVLLLGRHFSCLSNSYSINRLQKCRNLSENSSSNISIRPSVESFKYGSFTVNKRHYSFQTSMESLARSQSGLFKTLSESTPVEYCQKYLLYVHDFTGLSWWASIICSTILLRAAVTLPLAVYQQYILAKLENLKLDLPDIVRDLKSETALAVKMFKWDERTARAMYNRSLKKEWNKLIIRDNCHPLKATILLWFQIPMWVSLSISFRNLVYMLPSQDVTAQLTYAELMVGGFGIIPNLTIPDVSWIFPVSLGIFNLLIIELQLLARAPNMQRNKIQTILTNTFRVLSVLMVPISASVPSCLVLYWTTSSAYGLVQNLVLLSPKVKRLFRIPETSTEVKQPYQMVVSNLKTKLNLS